MVTKQQIDTAVKRMVNEALGSHGSGLLDSIIANLPDLSLDELFDLNKAVVRQCRVAQRERGREAAHKFRVGQKVEFYSKRRGYVYGVIEAINAVTIDVRENVTGVRWRVAPSLLVASKGAMSMNLVEWQEACIAAWPNENVEFTCEDGTGKTYGDVGDWCAHVGPDMQNDIVGVFVPGDFCNVIDADGTHEMEAKAAMEVFAKALKGVK